MQPISHRLNIVTGHYGSGKTTVSLNLAVCAAKAGRRVCLVDLDIVNPYFRAADSAGSLAEQGIRVIAPIYARTNLDIPALPPDIYAALEDTGCTVVIDVGGDDAGAAALGRFVPMITAEPYTHYYIVNARRPLTRTPEEAVAVLREIEAAGHLPATAVVNNTHLGPETDADVIRQSAPFAQAVAQQAGLPLAFTCVPRELADAVGRPDAFPIDIPPSFPWSDA